MITGLTSTQVAPGMVRVSWGSDLEEPVYRVFVDGVRWPDQVTGELDVKVREGESAHVEVFDGDDTTTVPSTVNSRMLTVRWTRLELASGYRVELKVGSDWVVQWRVEQSAENVGDYALPVGPLADDAEYELRVVAELVTGAEEIVVCEAALVAGVPTPPVQTVSWDEAEGEVVVGS